MNAYAVQVLATATGDPAAFRATVDAPHESPRPKQLWRHRQARQDFMREMSEQLGWKETRSLINQHDTEDPGYYLAWQERRADDSNTD